MAKMLHDIVVGMTVNMYNKDEQHSYKIYAIVAIQSVILSS